MKINCKSLNIVVNKFADVRPALSGPPKAQIKNCKSQD